MRVVAAVARVTVVRVQTGSFNYTVSAANRTWRRHMRRSGRGSGVREWCWRRGI